MKFETNVAYCVDLMFHSMFDGTHRYNSIFEHTSLINIGRCIDIVRNTKDISDVNYSVFTGILSYKTTNKQYTKNIPALRGYIMWCVEKMNDLDHYMFCKLDAVKSRSDWVFKYKRKHGVMCREFISLPINPIETNVSALLHKYGNKPMSFDRCVSCIDVVDLVRKINEQYS